MSQNVPALNLKDYVVCPYDKSHVLMPSRFAVHLVRCARNYPTKKLVQCTFHHKYSEVDKTHIGNCPRCKVMDINPEKMPPSTELEPPKFVVESSENWDDEPPAPTYDPQTHCDAVFVIRNPQGVPPSARREYRAREWMRYKELSKP